MPDTVPTVTENDAPMPGGKAMEAMAPAYPVTLIGTMNDPIPKVGTVAVTPGAQQSNLVVHAIITPLVAIAVRFGNDWCVSFSGSMLAGGMTTKVLPHTDMKDMLLAAVILATSIAGVAAIKNFATVFSGLEKKYPLASGSI